MRCWIYKKCKRQESNLLSQRDQILSLTFSHSTTLAYMFFSHFN